MSCRSKIAKIVSIGNPRWRYSGHIENVFLFFVVVVFFFFFFFFFFVVVVFFSFYNYFFFFFASSPEPNGQLTRTLVGRIRVTCRFKKS